MMPTDKHNNSTSDKQPDYPVVEETSGDIEYYRNSLKNPILDERSLKKQVDYEPADGAEEVREQDVPPEKQSTQAGKTVQNGVQGNIWITLPPKLLSILALFLLLSSTNRYYAMSDPKLTASLLELISESSSEASFIPIIIVLSEQHDTKALYPELTGLSRRQRRDIVVTQLKEFSARTQAELRSQIEILEAQGKVRNPQYLWISNVIALSADPSAIEQIAASPLVQRIEADPLRKVLEGSHITHLSPGTATQASFRTETRQIAPNVSLINAPSVWAQGFEGQGVLVGVIDSGVNSEHEDLAGRMWEHPGFPNHGYNFMENNHVTSDYLGHGTFSAGTIAGTGVSGIATGVAPQSTIMILKFSDNAGFSTQAIVWAAIQFGVEYGADVLNMSMGWQYSWNPDRGTWRNVVTNTMLAGVSSAIAAGNEGTGGLRTPGDCPAPWLHPDQTLLGGISGSVTVGATDYNDQIAQFSSRGPSTWANIAPFYDYPITPHGGLIKPDVVAPGVDIQSLAAHLNTEYGVASGTSFATPAVAGLMALMYSKQPNLSPEEVSRFLEENTMQLTPVKNNNTGSGRIDAFETVNATGAYIDILSYSINGLPGANPQNGQTVALNLNLINYSYEEVQGVTAVLTSADEYVTILSNSVYYGTIGEMSTGTSTSSYQLSFAEDTPHNHEAAFTLQLSATNGLSWEQELFIPVMAPLLEVQTPIVNDQFPGANGNNAVEPGETIQLYFPIANVGGAAAPGFDIAVQSSSPLVTMNGISNLAYSSLPVSETVYPSLNLSIADTALIGDELWFSYSFICGSYTFSGQFMVTVGGVCTIQIGSGIMVNSPSVATPINTHYRSLRGQMVYTVDELTQQGLAASNGGLIRELAFYVDSAPEHPLPNFVIRMKHTSATDASMHDNGPFTEVLNLPSYTPTAGGWDYLLFSTPFEWNGADNILVDTAFSQTTSFSSTGQQRVFLSPNGFRFTRADNADQTNLPTTSVSVNKPQILFRIVENQACNGVENLSAVSIGNRINLHWSAPTLPISLDSYNVYRNGLFLMNVDSDLTTYTDFDIHPSTDYYYFVRAVIDSVETLPSNIAGIRSEDPVSTPQICPDNSVQYAPVLVSISTDTVSAAIYYTLDGTEPDTTSMLYTGVFSVSAYHNQIKARAYKTDCFDSDVAIHNLYILLPPQNLWVQTSPGSVMLSWGEPDPGLSRRNDSQRQTPLGYYVYRSANGIDYSRITDSIVPQTNYLDTDLPSGEFSYYVTAVFDPGESLPSNSQTAAVMGFLPALTFSPEPGIYNQPIVVTITSPLGNPEIHYTSDGSDPDEFSAIFEGSLPIRASQTIRAIALQNGWYSSEICVGDYIIKSTAALDSAQAPLNTGIVSAFPNPFNPTSTIVFSLAEREQVSLEVFSIRGQKVKTLKNGILNPGEYNLSWHGDDDYGRRVASGIYLYRLKTATAIHTIKVIMLK